jgi:hypothetical protein
VANIPRDKLLIYFAMGSSRTPEIVGQHSRRLRRWAKETSKRSCGNVLFPDAP